MTEAEFLRRMDRHAERMDEHMTRGNVLMERVEEEMRLSRKDREEGRAFLRDLNMRQERITKELVEHIGGQTSILRDLHAETIAQRKSIWSVHDKLDELGGGPGKPAS